MKWAVYDKFNDYLYGNKFTVRTDNNPLTYVLTTAKLDATGHRWLAALAGFNFKLVYRAGVKNQDTDALHSIDKAVLFNDVIKAICQGVLASKENLTSVECVLLEQNASIENDEIDTDSGSNLSQVDWVAEQTVDAPIDRVRQLLLAGHKQA